MEAREASAQKGGSWGMEFELFQGLGCRAYVPNPYIIPVSISFSIFFSI